MLPNVTTALPGPPNSTAAVFDWEPFSYYTSPWRELQLVWVTICITLGTCGNTAVLLTISSVEELRTPGNTLLCTLAVADILQVISKGPLMIWLMTGQQILSCQSNGSLVLVLHLIYLTWAFFSVNIIGSISLDRYWYICFPLKYSSIMTKGRTALLVAVPLLVTFTNTVLVPYLEAGGGFFFFPPFVSCKYLGPAKKGRQATLNICYGIVILIMIFCYFKIWREVRRQQVRHRQLLPQALSAVVSGQAEITGTTRQTELSRSSSVDSGAESQRASPDEPGQISRQVSLTSLSARLCDAPSSAGHKGGLKPSNKVAPARICEDSSMGPGEPSTPPTRQKVPSEFKQRMKTATTVLLVIGVYFVTWLPYFVVLFRTAKFGDGVVSSDGPWQRFAMLFSLISAFANPFIYTRNRPFRQGFLRLFRCRN
ncbi:5-hydroxytryptamine receptor 1B-like [Branchiostoma lanceolatum]|uniref:5-hydroxytryptamine receptor 1B-like n=1 Tax=Branchiostoma lanceolatum TaxID=7740 RepID=UPI003456A150